MNFEISPDLFAEWLAEGRKLYVLPALIAGFVAEKAVEWAADQQLLRVNDWLRANGPHEGVRNELSIVRLDALATELWKAMRPKPPSLKEEVGELGELVLSLRETAARLDDDWYHASARIMRSAATLLQQLSAPAPVVVPVPVSERLPRPEDCDAEGRCWWVYPPDFMELRSHATEESAFVAGATHWLPAHALPLPAGEVE